MLDAVKVLHNDLSDMDVEVVPSVSAENLNRKKPGKSKQRSNYFFRIKSWWEIFQFILPKRIRKEAFEPAYNDLLSDFLKAKSYNNSKWARRWLYLCFICQTTYMIINCFRILIGSKLWAISILLVPSAVREFVDTIRRYFGN